MPKIRIEDLTKGWGNSSVVKLFVAQEAIMGARVWILGAHANARWLGWPHVIPVLRRQRQKTPQQDER